jgi:choline dehydrogenase-like flavoprotein
MSGSHDHDHDHDHDHRHFPDEDLPEGAVVDGELLARDVDEEFDYVVVGSGAAGAVAAHTLAKGGFAVAIVEEGPWVKTREFNETVYDAFKRMFRDAGTQVLEGHAFMPLIQGRCVGGSTVMNSAIAWRTPEDVLDEWRGRFGLGDTISAAALEPHFDALERDLNVHAVEDDALGENSRKFLEQGEKAGLRPSRMRRYERGCKGSGRCVTGCPNAAKQGMNVSYVPWALALGARVFASCRVDAVEIRGGRAVGVRATTTSSEPGLATRRAVRLRARRGVFVAASTVQTPNVLRRSGIRSRDLGKHFQVHPGVGMGGVFDQPVSMHVGATQGAESIQLRRTDRLKFESIAMQPELAAVRIPGVGSELMRRFDDFANLAVWAVLVRSEAEGTVSPGWGGHDRVKFSMTASDMEHIRKGTSTIARMMFEAGAREVWPGVFGLPHVLRSMDEVRLLEQGPVDARAYSFIATHLFGAARMGSDPRASVVGLDFQTHEARGLYVVDSSVFPTNLGVNPQHSIMAVSRLAATRAAEAAVVRDGTRTNARPATGATA